MLPKSFQPNGTYECVRLGKDNDGGYLVETQSIQKAHHLLSFGLCDDWSFEKDFLKRHEVPLDAYDHTLTKKFLLGRWVLTFLKMFIFRKSIFSVFRNFWKFLDYLAFFRKDRNHHRKKIGYDSTSSLSLDRILTDTVHDFPLFLKADIEGGEYRILDSLLTHSEKVCGLVIEFHDVDLHQRRIEKFIESFPLELVHIHGNNCGDSDPAGDPVTLEMTFAHNPRKVSDEISLPHVLDQPNTPKQKEVVLRFEQ